MCHKIDVLDLKKDNRKKNIERKHTKTWGVIVPEWFYYELFSSLDPAPFTQIF